jgi:aspartate kinase
VVDGGVAKVSVVASDALPCGRRRHDVQALAAENVNIKVITTSEIKISVLIDRKYMELAVQALHDAFGLEKAA